MAWMPSLIDQIRHFLQANGFYAYELLRPQISDNLLKEYLEVADRKSKRNLFFDRPWEKIGSFGVPRKMAVIDLGGTNLNLFEVQIDRTVRVLRSASVEFYEDKTYTPEVLFGDLKKHLDVFLPLRDRIDLKSLVFIFSFPQEQLKREDGYMDAVCTYFGKMRKSDGIVGLQVGKSFQDHLRVNGYPEVSVSVSNDTPIHCLAAKAYELLYGETYDAGMNVIVGTGTNISCAFDHVEKGNVKGLRLVNMEFGDFKGALPSRFDEIFDQASGTPGRYRMEKMLSGAYLHQILKIILKELLEDGILDTGRFSKFLVDDLNGEKVEAMLKNHGLTPEQKEILSFLWNEINRRGGALCGVMLAVMMKQILHDTKSNAMKFLIMETGSVLKKSTGFRQSLSHALDSELERLLVCSQVEYKLASLPDQPAYGAVIFDAFFSS